MTQSQTVLLNAAQAALKEAHSKIDLLRISASVDPSTNTGGEKAFQDRAAVQSQLKIDEALLWLREI